ncbi:metallophosphoesterase family protein [Thermodesulforhabdus norvegica]|uniref:Predicted phosphodiesterase n=1 Tax=Thermodesulforhabdus norvegica TaxID=39841 RepID=A0A1I4R118_9BACT|nr:metallophosphoesterase family protein [Thermodesulforhabdus norvegica]SFM46014.1 Predicted phosphodiesterase [Thermodesulforhabdus norvegica]
MAKFAVISDIHANLEALEAVFRDIEKRGADRIVHLGDVIGYNADPCEVIDRVLELGIIGVVGNHDAAAVDLKLAEGFNMLAYHSILYTRDRLDGHHYGYLASLPFSLILEGFMLFFHGSPESSSTYIANMYQAKRAFNYIVKQLPSVKIVFFGHTHVPKIWVRDPRGKVRALGVGASESEQLFYLDPENIYLINPGSVGQPRQRDNRASYVIFDTENSSVRFCAVSYDIEKAQRKILQARLPEFLAVRLAEGI